jgi:hypothetical protein
MCVCRAMLGNATIEAWMKAKDHVAGSFNDDQMLTIEIHVFYCHSKFSVDQSNRLPRSYVFQGRRCENCQYQIELAA